MSIRKAIIPAAGLGTRVLPASKAVPKEMLPIVDKPALQYIVEEAAASGITDILIITSRGKSVMEDHFDYAPELEGRLSTAGKDDLCQSLRNIADLCRIHFLRQKDTKGLGHAVLQARSFVGDEPFAVLYGDDVILSPSDRPATGELIAAYTQYRKPVVGIQPVSPQEIGKFCTLAVTEKSPRLFAVTDMIEKPLPHEVMSHYAILGRCLLTPDIFPILENTPPSRGGEIQLTDAMAVLARRDGILGVHYSGKRYDMGSKLGMLEAIVEVALAHPEVGADFRRYLSSLSLSS